MKKVHLFAGFMYVLLYILPSVVSAGTAFCLKKGGQMLVGKNHDYHIEECYVIINKRSLKKTAVVRSSDSKESIGIPATWTSRYGSVTLNQNAREFPSGGMNEAGLVVENTGHLVGNNKFPEPDSRPSIVCGQWMQYALDNFKTVAEVLESDEKIRIRPKPNSALMGHHFLVCDQSGDCAVIEFINGKRFVYTGESLSVKVLSNTEYSPSLQHRKNNTVPVPHKYGSITRFTKAADMIETFNPETSGPAADCAFRILEAVGRPAFFEVNGEKVRDFYSTVWSVVHDIQNRRIYFRTNLNREIRHLDLQAINFSCRTPVKVLDIHADLAGNVSENFIDYTPQVNRTLLNRYFTGMKPFGWSDDLAGIKKSEIEEAIKYPESFTCTE